MAALRTAPALFLLLAATACRGQTVELEDPFPNLSFASPIELMDAGDGTDLLYVAEKAGRIRVFANDPAVTEATLFLDLTDRAVDGGGGEGGLLGLAFDPDYAANGYVYVNYTTGGPFRTRISRFTRTGTSPPTADAASELVLLEVNQPYSNHNAGALAFGPAEGPGERYLYVTLGDGGSGGDPDGNGQDPGTLLGSILRLDVHGSGGPLDCGAGTGAATVPPGNPFVGQAGFCDELYAYGFRNPWRMRFDEVTGALWAGDVGQNQWEEIDRVEAGGNYGWNEYEGNHCYTAPCDPAGQTFPVYEYQHTGGRISITGGYVYRGSAIPDLQGKYVYGDLNGLVYTLDVSGSTPVNESLLSAAGTALCSFNYCLSSWGEDAEGELYLLGSAGPIRRLVRNPPVSNEPPPEPDLPAGLTLGPNPARDRTTVRFAAATAARLTLHDALGRTVAVLYDGPGRADGAVEVVAEPGVLGLAPGAYLVRLETGGAVQTRTLTVVR